jgi:hypothetical protein
MKCLKCEKEFYEKKSERKFCSKSCSNSFNNSNIRYKKINLSIKDKKMCRICNIEKKVTEFYKRKNSIDGYRNDCKDCQNKKSLENPNRNLNKKNYYISNKEKIKEKSKKWIQENKELSKETKKKYQECNKEKRNKYLIDRYNSDSVYKLSINCRGIIQKAFKRKGWKKNSKSEELIGCSFEELKIYLEKLFIDGMTWENHGDWHIDHKIPLSWAKDESELLRLFHYSNLQPLWAKDNLSKKNYYSN